MADFILLKTYFHKHDAEMVVGLLKDAGIQAILQSDDAGGFRPHLNLGMGNNRILIKKEDELKAIEVIGNVQVELTDEEMKRIEEVAIQTKAPDDVEK